jgi:hypothetical protein
MRLVTLEFSDLRLPDDDQDIRGRTVVDANGEEIGRVDGLLVDELERRVRFIRIAAGGVLGFGENHSFVPVDAISGVGRDEVRADRTGERIGAGPGYDPQLIIDEGWLGDAYGYYGYTPYWMPGYIYPYWWPRPR